MSSTWLSTVICFCSACIYACTTQLTSLNSQQHRYSTLLTGCMTAEFLLIFGTTVDFKLQGPYRWICVWRWPFACLLDPPTSTYWNQRDAQDHFVLLSMIYRRRHEQHSGVGDIIFSRVTENHSRSFCRGFRGGKESSVGIHTGIYLKGYRGRNFYR